MNTKAMEPERKARRGRMPARDYVIFLLGRREYSEKELRAKLKTRECTAEEIEAALNFVKETGIQSDVRYAGSKSRIDSRRKGDSRIRYALKAQGIGAETISAEIEQLTPEKERVISVIKRFEDLPFDLKLKGKVWRFLMYRGFSSDAVKAGIAHLERLARG